MDADEKDTMVKSRITKDITLFYESIGNVKSEDKKISHVIELSEMYASDSKSFLEKEDLYTAFSCISYAHGLLDAVKEIIG